MKHWAIISSILVVALVVSFSFLGVTTAPNSANAAKYHSTITDTITVTSPTTVCIGIQCFAVSPSTTTSTSTALTTLTTTETDTVTSTSTVTVTTTITSTVTKTELSTTTQTSTATKTTTSTSTATSVYPTTTTVTYTSTSTQTQTSTVTETTTTTATEVTTTTETVTTTVTTTSSGGGVGGGCVRSGTLITLANGTQVPVQDLHIGDKLLSYNTQTNQFMVTTLYNNTPSQVNKVVDINHGLVYASGLNDQPIYVQMQNGTQKWIELGQLQTGMRLFEPQQGQWISVKSVQTLNGSFTVYDVRTANAMINNYLGNGVLLDVKI